MTFNDSVHRYKLKNKATSIIKKYEVTKKIGLNSKVGIFLRDGDFSKNYGMVNLYPSRGSHLVIYKNGNCFDSYGCAPQQKLSKVIIKRNGYCLYSEYKIPGLKNRRFFL